MFTCSHIISVRIIKHLRLFNRCDLFVKKEKEAGADFKLLEILVVVHR